MRIILDTNKWYDIAEGNPPYREIKELHLCLTILNLNELFANPKLLINEASEDEKEKSKKQEERVLKVCDAILCLKPECIPYEPYDYIAKEVLGIDKPITHFGIEIITEFLNAELSQDEIKGYVEMKKQGLREFKKGMDEQQKAFRERIKELNSAEVADNDVFVKLIKDTRKILNISDKITPENISDWIKNADKIGFFLKGYKSYTHKLNSRKQIEAAKNDQVDLLNMIYVGLNDKYWCRDDKFLGKIQWDGIDNFLFKIPSHKGLSLHP